MVSTQDGEVPAYGPHRVPARRRGASGRSPGGTLNGPGETRPTALGAPTGAVRPGTGNGALLGPVHLVTAVDEVTDRLLTAIALGEFVPGDRLPAERELCRLLGVSRTTVRDAVARLKAGGVVEIRRGRSGGARVLDDWGSGSAQAVRRTLGPRLPELEQLLDLRARVEELVARSAAERRSGDDVTLLQSAVSAFRAAEDPGAEHLWDTRIHDAVLAAAGNPAITALSRDLLTRVSAGFPIEPYRSGVFEQALAEHEALVSAVVDGDVERAGAAAREHFAMSAQALRATLTRGMQEPDAAR